MEFSKTIKETYSIESSEPITTNVASNLVIKPDYISRLEMGNIKVNVDKKFNKFQCFMWKVCFGVTVTKIKDRHKKNKVHKK